MIRLKDIGSFKSVPQIVNDIINGNTSALDEQFLKGFDIEESIKIGKYTTLSPLKMLPKILLIAISCVKFYNCAYIPNDKGVVHLCRWM